MLKVRSSEKSDVTVNNLHKLSGFYCFELSNCKINIYKEIISPILKLNFFKNMADLKRKTYVTAACSWEVHDTVVRVLKSAIKWRTITQTYQLWSTVFNEENLLLQYNFKENFNQLTYCTWSERIIYSPLSQLEKINLLFFLECISSMYNTQSTL